MRTKFYVGIVLLLCRLKLCSPTLCQIDSLCSQSTGYLSLRKETVEIFVPISENADLLSVLSQVNPNLEVIHQCTQIENVAIVYCNPVESANSVLRVVLNVSAVDHSRPLKAVVHYYICQLSLNETSSCQWVSNVETVFTMHTSTLLSSARAPDFDGVVSILEPAFGTVIAKNLSIEISYADFRDAPAIVKEYELEVIGIIKESFPARLRHFAHSDIEPASWFYHFTPLLQQPQQSPLCKVKRPTMDGQIKRDLDIITDGIDEGGNFCNLRGYRTYGYIEFVLSEQDIATQRRYVTTAARVVRSIANSSGDGVYAAELSSDKSKQSQRSDGVEKMTKTSAQQMPNNKNKTNICIWSSNKMDGQKSIWLQQIEHLQVEKYHFTWLLTIADGYTIQDHVAANGSAATALYKKVWDTFARRGNGRIVDSPFNKVGLNTTALNIPPNDGRPSAAEVWEEDDRKLYR